MHNKAYKTEIQAITWKLKTLRVSF